MSKVEENGQRSGAPVRAIHESWLEMMQALRRFYGAKHGGDRETVSAAQAQLQQSVLGCYEMLRPYLVNKDAVEGFWEGQPPGYDGSEGVAVLAWQDHRKAVPAASLQWPADPDEELTFQDIHDQLDFGESVRVTQTHYQENEQNGDVVLVAYRVFEYGLQRLDGWHDTRQEVEKSKGGFMEGHTTTEIETNTVAERKLIRAARSLQNAADELGALAHFEEAAPETEITKEMVNEVEEWRQTVLE